MVAETIFVDVRFEAKANGDHQPHGSIAECSQGTDKDANADKTTGKASHWQLGVGKNDGSTKAGWSIRSFGFDTSEGRPGAGEAEAASANAWSATHRVNDSCE